MAARSRPPARRRHDGGVSDATGSPTDDRRPTGAEGNGGDGVRRTALTGRVVTPEGVVADGVVVVEGDRVLWAGPAREVPADLDGGSTPEGWAPGRTLLPGLVDTHCHGGAGGEFGPDADGVRRAAAHHRRAGSTTLLASLVSAPRQVLLDGMATCAPLVAAGELAGVHLEGPFLSAARRGAQNPAALVDPDPSLVEALVAAAAEGGAPGALRQMTWAPELPGGDTLPRLLAQLGVVPALGHTDSDVDTAVAALRTAREVAPYGGRPLVTHVFNGMAPMHHRTPGPVAACLGRAAVGDAVLEVIGDGVHLAPGTVRMLFEVVGPHGLHLVTDAMAASGMPEGDYTLGGQDVVVADGTARLAGDGSIAGGVATLLDVVRFVVRQAGVPLVDAVTAASATPAASLGLEGVGRLAPGARADVLVVDDELERVGVMVGGAWVA